MSKYKNSLFNVSKELMINYISILTTQLEIGSFNSLINSLQMEEKFNNHNLISKKSIFNPWILKIFWWLRIISIILQISSFCVRREVTWDKDYFSKKLSLIFSMSWKCLMKIFCIMKLRFLDRILFKKICVNKTTIYGIKKVIFKNKFMKSL